jgi:toxin CptA
MSIAVSAVIVPSRLLRLALCAWAAACAAVATVLAAGLHPPVMAPWPIAALCLLSALIALRAALAPETTRQIDISGLGEIRLLVQHSMAVAQPVPVLTLMAGSTVWPGLMVLRLGGEGMPDTVLLVLPDSTADEQVRKLGVAIRVIAGRDEQFSRKHQIL